MHPTCCEPAGWPQDVLSPLLIPGDPGQTVASLELGLEAGSQSVPTDFTLPAGRQQIRQGAYSPCPATAGVKSATE